MATVFLVAPLSENNNQIHFRKEIPVKNIYTKIPISASFITTHNVLHQRGYWIKSALVKPNYKGKQKKDLLAPITVARCITAEEERHPT